MSGCSCAGADTGSSINAVKGRGARRNAAVTVIVSKEPLRFDVSPTAEWILRAQNALMPLPQRRDRRHGRPQAALQDLYRACRRMRSEEHTSELQSLMRISSAVFCLKKKQTTTHIHT